MVNSLVAFLTLIFLNTHAMAAGKIVVILSGAKELPLKEGKTAPVGVYLNELMIPVMTLLDQKKSFVFVSPNGKAPTFDAMSDSPKAFGNDVKKYERAKTLAKELGLIGDSASFVKLEDLTQMKTTAVEAVFVPGGHAPLIDLVISKDLGAFLRRMHEANVPTGMICHGPIASISAIADPEAYVEALSSGDFKKAHELAHDWIYRDYPMTIFSKPEEVIAEQRKLGGQVLYYPDAALKNAGAKMVVKPAGQSNVVVHKELVTGQNPASAEEFAQVFANKIANSRKYEKFK